MARNPPTAWRSALGDRSFVVEFVATLAALLGALLGLRHLIVVHVEVRPAVELVDPILARIGPIDVALPLFCLLYASLVGTLVAIGPQPRRLVEGLQAYAVLIVLRTATLWLTPLAAPADTILLADPFLEQFFVDRPFRNDLFFSGHTAMATLLCLVLRDRRARWLLGALAVVVGTLVLVQHVHYTIDVVAAPFFALGSLRLVRALRPPAG